MSRFISNGELKKFGNAKLIELHLTESEEFTAAYILGTSSDYFAFAEIRNTGDFHGLTIASWTDVDVIKRDTLYLAELLKKIDINVIEKEVADSLLLVDSFSSLGDWINKLSGSEKIVGITYRGNVDDFAGKIVKHDDTMLLVDEYYSEYNSKFASSYLRLEEVSRLTIIILSKSLDYNNSKL
ncbi:MAG: hypothetical protein LBI13_11000 [Streptococcaceae bacterium]|jgi:hypothetical protein|nr:hypothetical protein [Streptococcaceae bacterium]